VLVRYEQQGKRHYELDTHDDAWKDKPERERMSEHSTKKKKKKSERKR